MKIDEKIKNVKININKSEYLDGIRELGIGLVLILGSFTMKDFPFGIWIIGSIVLYLVERYRNKNTKPVMGYYELNKLVSKKNRLTIIIAMFLSMPIIIPALMLIGVSFINQDFINHPEEFIIAGSNCINNPCTYYTLDLRFLMYILPIASGLMLTTFMFALILYTYKNSNLYRLKLVAIFSCIIGILLSMYLFVAPTFKFGQLYLIFVGMGFLISGIYGYLEFKKIYLSESGTK